MNIIIGVHSIEAAINNPKRQNKFLYLTSESKKQFKKYLKDIDYEILSAHALQEKAKEICKKEERDFQRVPSGAFLLCDELDFLGPAYLYDLVEKKSNFSIVCLDGVTDVHNAGAILRSASFYAVDALVVASKGSFGESPSFFKIASGATENVPVVRISSLAKVIPKLQVKGVKVVGLSEHATDEASELASSNIEKLCLVFGSEYKGMSHAVSRLVDHKVSLKPLSTTRGAIRSLNVSVACAVTMEKFLVK